jgi:predicted membrane channel-forming protein YqfA (hemolysin III family)
MSFGLSGIVPAIHYVWMEGWFSKISQASLGWLVLMGLLYILGALFYALRVPERWFPGKCDIWVSFEENPYLQNSNLHFFLYFSSNHIRFSTFLYWWQRLSITTELVKWPCTESPSGNAIFHTLQLHSRFTFSDSKM